MTPDCVQKWSTKCNAKPSSCLRNLVKIILTIQTPLNENLVTLPGCSATAVRKSDTEIHSTWEEIDTQGEGNSNFLRTYFVWKNILMNKDLLLSTC
jgi:hypothetical protein